MPIHRIAQYYTELYGPDEDQMSSYPSYNSGSDDEAKDEWLDVRSSNEDNMQGDTESIEVEAKKQRVRRAWGNDVAMVVELDIVLQKKLTR